jgi:hypothetical protein
MVDTPSEPTNMNYPTTDLYLPDISSPLKNANPSDLKSRRLSGAVSR